MANLKLQPGMSVIEHPDGSLEVVQNKEPMTKTVAFRLPASDYSRMMSFIETFPERTWAAGIRWLLMQPAVRAVMAERVEASTTRAPSGSGV